jgi:hypothetical protein
MDVFFSNAFILATWIPLDPKSFFKKIYETLL